MALTVHLIISVTKNRLQHYVRSFLHYMKKSLIARAISGKKKEKHRSSRRKIDFFGEVIIKRVTVIQIRIEEVAIGVGII